MPSRIPEPTWRRAFALRQSGLSFGRIADALGHDIDAIADGLRRRWPDLFGERASLAHGDWTEERVVELRALWAEGHSTAEIGRRMGISKNTVLGKAHRLQFDRRPSPIRRSGEPRPQRSAPARREATPEPAPLVTLPHVQPAPPSPALQPRRSAPCCWPIGEPGDPVFRYCDELAVSGKPYCPLHCALAYAKAASDAA